MSLADTREIALRDRMPPGLLDRIVAQLNPLKVIVFGSQVTGNTHADSDWDLLIVVDDDTPTEKVNSQGIYEARKDINAAIDLIPCREATFRYEEDIVGSLPWIAINEGMVVYERAALT